MFSKARLLTVEGGEGVGKSVFTAGLAQQLRRLGITVTTTREPGGTAVADQIRGVFAAPAGGETLTCATEALLVSAARAQHVQHLLRPALAAGSWVVCDRFVDSTRVYQGTLGGLPSGDVERLISLVCDDLVPDLTFVLDAPTALLRARLSRRSSSDDQVERYDQATVAVHEQIRQAFLGLLAQAPERMVRIDAQGSPPQMLAQAMAAVEARFGVS